MVREGKQRKRVHPCPHCRTHTVVAFRYYNRGALSKGISHGIQYSFHSFASCFPIVRVRVRNTTKPQGFIIRPPLLTANKVFFIVTEFMRNAQRPRRPSPLVIRHLASTCRSASVRGSALALMLSASWAESRRLEALQRTPVSTVAQRTNGRYTRPSSFNRGLNTVCATVEPEVRSAARPPTFGFLPRGLPRGPQLADSTSVGGPRLERSQVKTGASLRKHHGGWTISYKRLR
jgi:hypothetical protein